MECKESASACGGPDCLMAQLSNAVQVLATDVLALHETLRKVRVDSALQRAQYVVWTCAGALLSTVLILWLYERLF